MCGYLERGDYIDAFPAWLDGQFVEDIGFFTRGDVLRISAATFHNHLHCPRESTLHPPILVQVRRARVDSYAGPSLSPPQTTEATLVGSDEARGERSLA